MLAPFITVKLPRPSLRACWWWGRSKEHWASLHSRIRNGFEKPKPEATGWLSPKRNRQQTRRFSELPKRGVKGKTCLKPNLKVREKKKPTTFYILKDCFLSLSFWSDSPRWEEMIVLSPRSKLLNQLIPSGLEHKLITQIYCQVILKVSTNITLMGFHWITNNHPLSTGLPTKTPGIYDPVWLVTTSAVENPWNIHPIVQVVHPPIEWL